MTNDASVGHFATILQDARSNYQEGDIYNQAQFLYFIPQLLLPPQI
jgi:hypothetical protein